MLTPQQRVEVEFWRRCFQDEEEGSTVRWMARRESDYRAVEAWFQPAISSQKGLGLDLGCGLTSTLGFRETPIIAVDPLLAEYDKIYLDCRGWIVYCQGSGESLSFDDQMLDYVWCINVIDHTPNPERMASEIFRVLKPGGVLYFSVNFDSALYSPHYQLWRRDTVDRMLGAFKMLEATERWHAGFNKYIFSGIYARV